MKKIIFIGNKNTAYFSLKYIINLMKQNSYKNFSLECVITRLGSKNQWFLPAKKLAENDGIKVYTPSNINDSEFIEKISGYKPDIGFCVFYPQIFKKEFLEIFPEGVINLHFAPLPKYRGCNPIPHAIIDGRTQHGVTIHYMNPDIDAGAIIAQKFIEIEETDIGMDLYKKCEVAGIELFREQFKSIIDNKITSTKQNPNEVIHHFRNELLDNKEVDLRWDKKKIYDFVRALEFPPFEPSFIKYKEKKIFLTTKPDSKYDTSHLKEYIDE